MTVLKILTIPDPRLKLKSEKVLHFNKELEITVSNMFDTLNSSGNGIGLAAPQVGLTKRIVVIDLKIEGKTDPLIFINPEIIKFSNQKFLNEEGCLSVPEYYAEVERSKEVEVQWYDLKGKKIRKKLEGLLSICIQHEIDHLDGILFIDHLSKLKRRLVFEKLKKLKRKNEKQSSN